MHRKKWLSALLGALIGTMSLSASVYAADSVTALPKTEGKPRLLVTQDGEVDDMNTLIHTLLYANDIDLEGIVQTSSKLHYSGDDTTESLRWMGTDWMYEFMDAYAEVYANLKVHDADYPSPDDLRAITKVGNIKNVSDTSEETEAAGEETTSAETDSTEVDTSVLGDEAKNNYDRFALFAKGEYEGDADSLLAATENTEFTATVVLDGQTGKSLADTVEKDYYDVLKDGAASYVADGTETYVSAELNMMDQKLKKLFGIDATEENTDVTDETTVLLADVPEEDKQTLYKDTMKFLAGLYGENTDATEESAAE